MSNSHFSSIFLQNMSPWPGDTTPVVGSQGCDREGHVMDKLCQSCHVPPWLIQTPTWHQDSHSIISQSEANIVSRDLSQPIRSQYCVTWSLSANNRQRAMCRQIRCFVWCNWGQTRHAEQRNLFSEYWWWLFTRQFIQTHFHHKIL